MAGAKTSAKLLVPQRDSRIYQASITPGTVPARRPSSTGSFPPLCVLYQSIVANLGAVPSASTEYTFFDRAS
jgi:hypothetical protein